MLNKLLGAFFALLLLYPFIYPQHVARLRRRQVSRELLSTLGGSHMPADRVDEERPCLHCMMVELIDDFFAEYPATGGSDKVDTAEADEVIDAIAKTVAELTSQQDGVVRQQVIEQWMRQLLRRRVSP